MTIALSESRGRKIDPDSPQSSPLQIAPVVTWLASEAGRDVTGQIIHVARGQVAIMQQPALIAAYECDDFWDLEALDTAIPALVEARRVHDEQVAKAAEPRRL